MAAKSKTKVKKEVSEASTLDVTLAAIEKKYGKHITTLAEASKKGIQTVSTGSLLLDMALGRGGPARGRVYEFFGPPGGGKCITADSYLCTEHGLLTVEELYKLNGTPISEEDKNIECSYKLLNFKGKMEETSHFVWSGLQQTKGILTSGGFELRGTVQHRVKVISTSGAIEWRQLGDIKVGDYILISKTSRDLTKEDKASYININKLVTDTLDNQHAGIPFSIRSSSSDVIMLFLSTLFRRMAYSTGDHLNIDSSSLKLLKEIQLLLLSNFGMTASIAKRDDYTLSLYYTQVEDFGEDHAFLRQAIYDVVTCNASHELAEDSGGPYPFGIPYQTELIKEIINNMESVPSFINDLLEKDTITEYDLLGINYIFHNKASKYGINEFAFNTYLELYDLVRNYAADVVVDTFYSEDKEAVFDFVLPKTHSFVSNGIISHNTTLAANIVREAQNKGLKCVFADAERSMDPKLFKDLGVNMNDLLVLKFDTAEQYIDAIETLIRSKCIGVVVVDSVAALVPSSEVDGEITDSNMGTHAKFIRKSVRRLIGPADDTNTMLIFINHVTNKMTSYGNPETTTGGSALSFFCTGRIRVSGGSSKTSRLMDSTGDVVGHLSDFWIEKNKLAAPYKTVTTNLNYSKGYDTSREVLKLAVEFGIIDSNKSYYYIDDKMVACGMEALEDYVMKDIDVFNDIKEKVLVTSGLKDLYETTIQEVEESPELEIEPKDE